MCVAGFSSSKDGAVNTESTVLFKRIAHSFTMDEDELKCDFTHVRRSALEIYNEDVAQTSTFECWRKAYLDAVARRYKARPCTALQRVLRAHGMFNGRATSSNERAFVRRGK